MKKTILIITTMLALTACESQPPQTLDQKLAEATTPADRKERLRLACLNEAEWPATLHKMRTGSRRATYERMRAKETSEIREMKSLCRQMDNLTTTDVDEKLSAKKLASVCAAKVAEKKAQGSNAHAARLQQICSAMTNVSAK